MMRQFVAVFLLCMHARLLHSLRCGSAKRQHRACGARPRIPAAGASAHACERKRGGASTHAAAAADVRGQAWISG